MPLHKFSPFPAAGRRVAGTRPKRGFTLVELMITLVVAAILLTLAVPSFLNLIVSNRLVAAAHGVVSAIDAARATAINHNASTQFCSDDNALNAAADGLDPDARLAAGCAGAGAGAVYTLVNADYAKVLAAAGGLAALQLHGHVAALRCDSQGICWEAGKSTEPFTGDVANLCSSRLSGNNHYVIRMTGGTATRIDITSGDCP
jgi:type IV fimbrial biogenesis protein FimT